MDSRLKTAAQRYGVSAVVDYRQVLALIAAPRGKVILRGGNGKREQQHYADHSECPHCVAKKRMPCRGEKLSNRLHLTPPRKDPGPSRAAEPCAHSSEHDQFE